MNVGKMDFNHNDQQGTERGVDPSIAENTWGNKSSFGPSDFHTHPSPR